ncbi:MAG TPA: endonuclease [Sedimenticola thiotaurini]|uniref:Endonuclease n=1 Tax=Sedimenticola thiotaurini TaxID=1543721 RepID=A0A831W916_9GAMM|nr:endonuclease [Sedimenticola thiotaurini]
MPTIHDTPPPAVRADLQALRGYLDRRIPPKMLDRNLLIATWNIRSFSSLTRKWTAGPGDSPKRDLRGLLAIIEIIRRFDVIAIQEVRGNLRALRDTMKALGDDWGFLMTDVTAGEAGNGERMAYLFDRRRVKPSGLACELVVPPEWLQGASLQELSRQFARTPYAISFLTLRTTFILVTVHINYGQDPAGRIPELRGVARWMRRWANQSTAYSHNLIALGDFNIDRHGDALWQAFTSTGLSAPEALNEVPRTIFGDSGTEQFYDQIAWFRTGSGVNKLNMEYLGAGYVDFLPYVYRDRGLSRQAVSYRVSDHYPLWAEFSVR